MQSTEEVEMKKQEEKEEAKKKTSGRKWTFRHSCIKITKIVDEKKKGIGISAKQK